MKGCIVRKSLLAAAVTMTSAAFVAAGCLPAAAAIPSTETHEPVSKVLVFVEENHSLAQMQKGLPYAYKLARKYGYASNYKAITHPSLPNYIAIASARTYGIRDDKNPSSHKLTGHSVFGQAIAAGKTAATYADGMTSNCKLTKGGRSYVPRHNPWAYFVEERALCKKFDLPTGKLGPAITTGTLPNVGMVIPNLKHDAHDGSLRAADQWFKAWIAKIAAGPDWKSGRLAIVLTADEDDRHSNNKVLTVVIHRSQKGRVVKTALTHYSLTRLFSEVTGTKPLHNGRTAPSMMKAFKLPVGTAAKAAPATAGAASQHAIAPQHVPLID